MADREGSQRKRSEKEIMQRIQRQAPMLLHKNARLFRNNTGLFRTEYGGVVRTGLAVGSSDLIGFTPITILPEMVGFDLAIFTAIEVKQPGKRPTKEQANFLKQVSEKGGLAILASDPKDLRNGLNYYLHQF